MARKKKNTGGDKDEEPPVRRSSRSSTIQKREESIRKAEEEKAKKEAKKAKQMEEEEVDEWDMDWDEDQGAADLINRQDPEALIGAVDLNGILDKLRQQFPDILDNPDALDAAGVLATMNQMFVIPGLELAGDGAGQVPMKEVKQEEPDEYEALISGHDQLDDLETQGSNHMYHSDALLNLEATDKDWEGTDKILNDCGRRMDSEVMSDQFEATDKDSGAFEKILEKNRSNKTSEVTDKKLDTDKDCKGADKALKRATSDYGSRMNSKVTSNHLETADKDSDNVFGTDKTSGVTDKMLGTNLNSVKLIQKHTWNPQPPEPVLLPDGFTQRDFLLFDVPSGTPTTQQLASWIQNLTGFLPPNVIKIQKGFSLVSGETPVHIVKFSTSESLGNFLERLLNSQNPRTLNSGAELIYLTKNLSEDSIAMMSLMILIGREVQKSSGRVDKVITVGNMCLILKNDLGGDCELDMAELLSGHYLAMTRIAHSKLNQKARKRVRFVIGVMGFPRDILPM